MKKSTIGMIALVAVTVFAFTGCINQVVEVPDLEKNTLDNAKSLLDQKGLLISVVGKVESPDVEKGRICKQDPLPRSDVKRGSTIKVWISKGATKVEIPELGGMGLNDALRKVAEAGLYPNVEYVYSEDVPKDMVASVEPAPGSMVEENSTVTAKISMGEEPPKTAVVPKVTGMSKSKASSKLEEIGLESKFVYRVHTEYYEGTLYYQTPKAGSVVPVGSTITVYIATVLD